MENHFVQNEKTAFAMLSPPNEAKRSRKIQKTSKAPYPSPVRSILQNYDYTKRPSLRTAPQFFAPLMSFTISKTGESGQAKKVMRQIK